MFRQSRCHLIDPRLHDSSLRELVAGLCVKEPAARLHLGDVLAALDAALNANGAV